jgi:hypothetical protein
MKRSEFRDSTSTEALSRRQNLDMAHGESSGDAVSRSTRSSAAVRAEMDAVSQSLDRLQLEYRRVMRIEAGVAKGHDAEAQPVANMIGQAAVSMLLNDSNDKTGVLRRMRDYALEEHDVRDAADYKTELSEMFGFDYHAIDGELDRALLPALDKIVELAELVEAGKATPYSLGVEALRVGMEGHPRGFGRYFVVVETPWPRNSAVIQAQIESETLQLVDWLRFELNCAREEEALAAKSGE